jgi:flagellar biosynthesis/type III secretory pathway chaperone
MSEFIDDLAATAAAAPVDAYQEQLQALDALADVVRAGHFDAFARGQINRVMLRLLDEHRKTLQQALRLSEQLRDAHARMAAYVEAAEARDGTAAVTNPTGRLRSHGIRLPEP